MAGYPPVKGREEENNIAGTIQITFIHHEPDLSIQVPPIPG